MLTLTPISQHQDKLPFLEQFEPQSMTWIVADLMSKSEIQIRLLEKYGVLEENAVLRASELWTKLFRDIYPGWRLVSHDFLRSQLTEFLNQQEHAFAHTPGASSTLMTFMQQLLPILSSSDGEENIRQWFQENSEAFIRWGHWFELSLLAWEEIQSLKMVTATWCSGLLVQHPDIGKYWPRQIIADIGCQLHAVEAELLNTLAQNTDVEVLEPRNSWTPRYQRTLAAYDILAQRGLNIDAEIPALPVPHTPKYKHFAVERYSTMVAEVKDTVSKIRSDLEAGLLPIQISVLAPDIEVYWPVLSHYLKQEGIPFQKPIVARMQTFSSVDLWLAHLHLSMGKISSADLERVSFGEQQQFKSLSFDRFKRLFSNIYDETDLNRWDKIKNLFAKQKVDSEQLTVDQFLAWVASFWPDNDDTDALAKVVKKIYTESPMVLERSLSAWMDLLENIVAKEEIVIEESQSNGIFCLNIQEGDWVEVKSQYLIGVTAEGLRSQDTTGLLFTDVQKIYNDLGYALIWPDKAHIEFDCLWVLQNPTPQLTMSVSATDFGGQILAPSLIWLLTAFENQIDMEHLTLPQKTRWDEIQQSSLQQVANFRHWSEQHAKTLEQSILQDLGEVAPDNFAGELPWTLSASQLESYLQCPFKFAAAKIFGLVDEPDLDLDVDRMSQGKMLHKLFEKLIEQPFRSSWTAEELNELVDQLPKLTDSPLADTRLWVSIRTFYLDLAQRFLMNEAELRNKFPELQTCGKELFLHAKWSPQLQKLVPLDQPGIEFRGFVDRIDKDERGRYVVVDYKSSDSTQTSYRSWVDKKSLQLSLYSMALEQGLSELPANTVVGAFFYSAKTMAREKGFRMDEFIGTLYDDNKRSLSHLQNEKKQELFSEINSLVQNAVERMQSGEFAPDPDENTQCQQCSWIQLCRAPHLNS